jgi:hypothetical protein
MIIVVIIMRTYLIFRRDLLVDILNLLFLVGIAAHKSWINPIGQTQPQNTRLVNNKIKIKTASKKNGNTPSAIEKKIYSNIPDPLEIGFLGEFKIGNTLTTSSKLLRLIGKIVSRIT